MEEKGNRRDIKGTDILENQNCPHPEGTLYIKEEVLLTNESSKKLHTTIE